MNSPANLPATGYVRLPTVAAVCGIGKSTVWEWCRKGRFPAPIKLSMRVSAWSVDDVRAWLADPNGWRPTQPQGRPS
ncbi:AlpA family phage regulatory protein [Paralcaligenes sp. KSB-10]|uniref:helix-turn-helix transcriptional regulator n=1 Tax=Paralcaligenes sp. KSB-10 TaxID=2901142 RepID=UPI001E49D7ED|nr:AlpA family phage regulatory protein [Paralcaligenes sp. KSB-10]UHL65571.1 AlpA family phage regulatory protein [Paralcaligenes sp. KSB-10]